MSYVTDGLPSEHSPAEQALYRLQSTGCLKGWVFNKHLFLDGHHLYVDLVYETMWVKIAVEIDGQQHDDLTHFLRDTDRDDLLRKHGYTVKRFDHGRTVRNPEQVAQWCDEAAVNLAKAKAAMIAERQENQKAALRRKIADLVQRTALLEKEVGKWKGRPEADICKHLNTVLAKNFGRANDRTMEQHEAAFRMLQEHHDNLRTASDEMAQQAAEEEAARELDELRWSVMTELLTDFPGRTWDELIAEAEQCRNNDPLDEVGMPWHHFNEYHDDMGFDSIAFVETLQDMETLKRAERLPHPAAPDNEEHDRWYCA